MEPTSGTPRSGFGEVNEAVIAGENPPTILADAAVSSGVGLDAAAAVVASVTSMVTRRAITRANRYTASTRPVPSALQFSLGAYPRDAPGRNRTCDLALRRRALYPLSYGRGDSGECTGHSRPAVLDSGHLVDGDKLADVLAYVAQITEK